MTAQPSQSVLINGFGVLFVILNSFGLGLRLSVGELLGQAFAHRKLAAWVLVINFVIIPLLFVGYLLTVASSIPDEIKVGFCVAALCAGMPFAPILARLAKADVGISTTLLVLLTVGTIIALPIGLPLAIDAVDAHLEVSVWDVAWPLLAFLLLPLVLGCGFRTLVARSDAAIGAVDGPGRNSVPALQSQLHAGCVLGSVREGVGQRELHRGPCWPVHRPRVWLPPGVQPSRQRRGSQACDRGDHGGTQHRSDAPDDDLSLCSRPPGHGVDHDHQHRRHRDHSSICPDVEARCSTIGHRRNYRPVSERRPTPASLGCGGTSLDEVAARRPKSCALDLDLNRSMHHPLTSRILPSASSAVERRP